jgi:hypothetical protein
MSELFTVDGFNLEKVTSMVDASDLGALQKTVLTKGLDAAQDNPELLSAALTKIREALGM